VRGRKAIILLSDGEDHGSEVTSDALLTSQAEGDAMIYSIYYQPEFQRFLDNRPHEFPGGRFPGRRRGGRFNHALPQRPGGGQGRRRPPWLDNDGQQIMEKLAEVTGGRFYHGETKHLQDTFALIAEELRHQYRLGFYPGDLKRDGSVHGLLVRVNLPDVSVRARREYLAR